MFKKYLLIAGLSFLALENSLSPFSSDGCTYFANGTKTSPDLWLHCCQEHDLRYWFGGSMKERDQCDLQLKSCVNVVAGKKWASIIYSGVRMGHASPVKNKGHWGWGWTLSRENNELNQNEKAYVLDELLRLNLDPLFLEQFIRRNQL